jgi:hypothetical protein
MLWSQLIAVFVNHNGIDISFVIMFVFGMTFKVT